MKLQRELNLTRYVQHFAIGVVSNRRIPSSGVRDAVRNLKTTGPFRVLGLIPLPLGRLARRQWNFATSSRRRISNFWNPLY